MNEFVNKLLYSIYNHLRFKVRVFIQDETPDSLNGFIFKYSDVVKDYVCNIYINPKESSLVLYHKIQRIIIKYHQLKPSLTDETKVERRFTMSENFKEVNTPLYINPYTKLSVKQLYHLLKITHPQLVDKIKQSNLLDFDNDKIKIKLSLNSVGYTSYTEKHLEQLISLIRKT